MIVRSILIMLIAGSVSAFAQDSCRSISKTIIKTYESYTTDHFLKLKKKKKVDTETLFNVAEFLRFKGDTLYKYWYINYIDRTNAEFNGCDKSKVNTACVLFKMAKSYYYTGNLQHAEAYLMKAIKAKCTDHCIEYYSGLMKQAQQK